MSLLFFFEKLAWDTYEFEQADGAFGYPTHGEYFFPTNRQQQDQFIDSHCRQCHSCVPPILCDYCESFHHNSYNHPNGDYVDTRCQSLGKTINEMTDKLVETIKSENC